MNTLTAQGAALETLVRAEGVFIIAVSTRQQEAIEIRELGHGILTYALLRGLGANGADQAASPRHCPPRGPVHLRRHGDASAPSERRLS